MLLGVPELPQGWGSPSKTPVPGWLAGEVEPGREAGAALGDLALELPAVSSGGQAWSLGF